MPLPGLGLSSTDVDQSATTISPEQAVRAGGTRQYANINMATGASRVSAPTSGDGVTSSAWLWIALAGVGAVALWLILRRH